MEKKKTVLSKTEEMVIGKNKYIVTTSFSATARETAEQKFMRYVTDRVSSALNSSEISGDKGIIQSLLLAMCGALLTI